MSFSKLVDMYVSRRLTNCRSTLPRPRGLPFIGNLLQLGSQPHLTLTAWGKLFGPVFGVSLGSWNAVIINGYSATKEALCLKRDDFAGRPNFASFKDYAEGKSISFQNYGERYRAHRYVAFRSLKEVLSDKDFDVDDLIMQYASRLVSTLCESTCAVNPAKSVHAAIAGILYSISYGKGQVLAENTELVDLLTSPNPSTDLFAFGNQTDLLPSIRYVSKILLQKQQSSRMEKLVLVNKEKYKEHLEMKLQEKCVMNLILKRPARQESSDAAAAADQSDYDAYFASTTVELLSAGTETSSATLLWLILYMARYPSVQKLVHKEIDSNLQPASHDAALFGRLPFTEAVIWEVMRLNTIVPFALPHSTVRDTTLRGHRIAKDTLVFVNLWSVCRDPAVWGEPERFLPERFLKRVGEDVVKIDRAKVEMFMPFSAGSRRCLGEALGKRQVAQTFVELMRQCSVTADDSLDMTPKFGDVMQPQPFKVHFKTRSPPRECNR